MQPTPYPEAKAPGFMPQFVEAPPPMVVTTQPTIFVTPTPVCKDYLGLSIMTMILCCLPLGAVALNFSIQTRDAINRQDSLSASSHSRSAFTWNMVALGLGLCINIAWIGYAIFYGVAFSYW